MSVEEKMYKLKEAGIRFQKPDYSNSIEIYIEGDYNDDDLVPKTSFHSVDEFIELYPSLKVLKNYKNGGNNDGNWIFRTSYLTKDNIELLLNKDILPFPPEHEPDFHTIKTIKAYFRCSDGNRYKIVI